MSTTYSPATTIIDENEPSEGWTLTPAPAPVHDDGWGTPAAENRPDSWEHPPAAPSPPLSAFKPTNHASMHWTACYDDYCGIHRHAKDNNYYPHRAEAPRRRGPKRHRPCGCPHPHPFELAEVIRNKHLDPRKACADWYRGKRVCPHCEFLVNLEGHQDRCGARRAPLAEVKTEEENETPSVALPPNEEENQENEPPLPIAIQNLTHAVAIAQQTAAIGLVTAQQALAQQREAHRRLERLEAIHARRRASRVQRLPIHAPPPYRRRRNRTPPHHDLAGASVWAGGVLSRTSRDRLLSALASAIITTAGLWLVIVTGVAVSYVVRG